MEKKVLVTYASKYGATAGIAEKIGETLKAQGYSVEVSPVKQVKDISIYQAVILGSGVYAGGWLKPASDFLQSKEKDLVKIPVWLFSDGPTGEGDPLELMKGWRFTDNLRPLAGRIKPRDMALFHGKMILEELNFAEKMLIKAMKAQLGDYRDWDAISAWAMDIAESLK